MNYRAGCLKKFQRASRALHGHLGVFLEVFGVDKRDLGSVLGFSAAFRGIFRGFLEGLSEAQERFRGFQGRVKRFLEEVL